MHALLLDLAVEWRAVRLEVRDELAERFRIQHEPRDAHRADLGALLEHAELELAELVALLLTLLDRRVVLLHELHQVIRARETGGAASDEQGVDLHHLALDAVGFGFLVVVLWTDE